MDRFVAPVSMSGIAQTGPTARACKRRKAPPRRRQRMPPFLIVAQPIWRAVLTSWPTISRDRRQSTYSSRRTFTKPIRSLASLPRGKQSPALASPTEILRESRRLIRRPRGSQATSARELSSHGTQRRRPSPQGLSIQLGHSWWNITPRATSTTAGSGPLRSTNEGVRRAPEEAAPEPICAPRPVSATRRRARELPAACLAAGFSAKPASAPSGRRRCA